VLPPSFPVARPPGLRRRRLRAGTELWRIDSDPPADWRWTGFPVPRNRFDPASGSFRVRYAATTVPGAARERYAATGRYIPTDHGTHQLVRLEADRPLLVVDLKTESNLDALGLDDRISTSRDPETAATGHRLCDALRAWWPDGDAGGLDGILYRSRTTPETSSNLAFFALGGFRVTSRRLSLCVTELDDLVLRHGFTIGFEY
jgi:RES domain